MSVDKEHNTTSKKGRANSERENSVEVHDHIKGTDINRDRTRVIVNYY